MFSFLNDKHTWPFSYGEREDEGITHAVEFFYLENYETALIPAWKKKQAGESFDADLARWISNSQLPNSNRTVVYDTDTEVSMTSQDIVNASVELRIRESGVDALRMFFPGLP